MMRKLVVVLLVGFVHYSTSTHMRYEQGFYDPGLQGDPGYKREHIFPRDSMVQPEQMLPPQGVIRNEPIYVNEAMLPPPPPPPPQQTVIHNDDFLQSDQMMQTEPIMRSEAFIREPIIRREPIIHREPIIRREPIFRNEQVIRSGRIYQNAPVIRDGGIITNEPNGYTFMLAPCPCQSESQNFAPIARQEAVLQIPQRIQIQQPQPIFTHRIIYPKQMIKQQAYAPMIAFQRTQPFIRKPFRPIQENIQFPVPQIKNTQDFNAFTSEPVTFPANFQNQAPPQENTPEPGQNNPVTVRTVPQMPNPLTLAQMSSIC